jgi:hypothetical protein
MPNLSWHNVKPENVPQKNSWKEDYWQEGRDYKPHPPSAIPRLTMDIPSPTKPGIAAHDRETKWLIRICVTSFLALVAIVSLSWLVR